jgi:ATP/maltotriose-dependent transcriptional regulator MalT
MMLAGWRGREPEATELIQLVSRRAAERGVGGLVDLAACVSAVLHNGLAEYDAAREAAGRAFRRDAARSAAEGDPVGYGPLSVPELAEAAARTGDLTLLRATLEWLSERARVTPTDWALGMAARVRALLADDDAAESHYRESMEHLGRTRLRAQLARGQLLYGEWLRRRGRRADAREPLRTAWRMLDQMGMEAFAERARRELLAAGESSSKVNVQSAGTCPGPLSEPLTAQEAQIARLAREGLSNPEIGARMFLSPRTVEWHLGKVFTKLGIGSRRQLHGVLLGDARAALPAASAD